MNIGMDQHYIAASYMIGDVPGVFFLYLLTGAVQLLEAQARAFTKMYFTQKYITCSRCKSELMSRVTC